MWLYVNMLCVMKYGKEKGCAEGAKIFWIMYLRRNCAEGAKKILRKNFGPPSLTLKKFWSPPLWHTEKILVPPFDYPKKFWSPPQTDGPPLPVINDSSLSRHLKARLAQGYKIGLHWTVFQESCHNFWVSKMQLISLQVIADTVKVWKSIWNMFLH